MSEELVPGFEYEEGLAGPSIDLHKLGASYPVTIGRRAHNTLVLHHSSVSGRHAQIERMETDGQFQYFVQDVGSTNGTKVEGEPVQRRELKNGDMVHFGDVGLRFGLVPQTWWEESRKDYLAGSLPWPLAVPFFKLQTTADPRERVVHLYRLCDEMTRLITATGSAVAAANGGADSALRWGMRRLRDPKASDWIGAVNAVIRAGTHRGWLEHLPGLVGAVSGMVPGTEGAWAAMQQWVRGAGKTENIHEMEAIIQVLEPGVIELLLAWTFLHEGRLIWAHKESDEAWTFTVWVAHGPRPPMVLSGVQFYGQTPGERVPYWILSAAGGAACLAPWYRVTTDPQVPIVSWEGCPDDMAPTYRAADTGMIVEFPERETTIPMGAAGAYQWSGFEDYLAADRSAGAVVDLRTSPEKWSAILDAVKAEDISLEFTDFSV